MRRRVVVGVRVSVRVGPFAAVAVPVVLGTDGDAQTVQACGAGGIGVETEGLGEKGADRFFDGGDVSAQRGEGGKDHVAAGAAHAVEPDELFHDSSLQGTGPELQREKRGVYSTL